jgi:small-conductance mechanosensitive channel
MNFQEILDYNIVYGITAGKLMAAFLVLVFARLLVWVVQDVLLKRFFLRKKIDIGRQYALKQFLAYLIWALAVFAILEMMGISSMLWASSAALLVGIGLGLQDTFKDLISGIVILIEGTVEVGDILEVSGLVAKVTKIGLRTSKVETRDGVSILIPNSKLVVENVINWSHNDAPTRFNVKVGVAYGSDLELVQRLLLKAANDHPKVLQTHPARVQFKNFGESSLDFELLFFSDEFFRIEFVKSEIRMAIDRHFRKNGVKIPFPQRDLWFRNTDKNATFED